MDIDQRIEVLTQSVELLAIFHKDLEERMDRGMGQLIEIVTPIAQIVLEHQNRITRLEDRPSG